jgi:hypothetical protein
MNHGHFDYLYQIYLDLMVEVELVYRDNEFLGDVVVVFVEIMVVIIAEVYN